MLVCLSIIIALLLGTYFYTFSNFTFCDFPFLESKCFGKLSQNSQDWANFGTYIGGTLGPIGAFLAFWGLMQQNKMYKEHAEIERLTTKLIALDADISALTQKIFTTTSNPVSLYQLMVNNQLSMHNIINSMPSDDRQTGFIEYKPQDRILESLQKQLILLNNYIKKVQHIDPDNIEIMHYNAKYRDLLEQMHNNNWVKFRSFGS